MTHAVVKFAAGAALSVLMVTLIAGVDWMPFSGTRQSLQDLYHHHMLEQQDVVDFKDQAADAVQRAKSWRPNVRSLAGPDILGPFGDAAGPDAAGPEEATIPSESVASSALAPSPAGSVTLPTGALCATGTGGGGVYVPGG
ncbi:hypothetical protein WJX73_003457 [Symbiochloris irregularis]|uniref:Uncharacterized protein n=1 Tax=Symbiochloris irregularis TaxID=706552 RepID=A0AAW1PA88_9CHLO